MNIRCLSGLLLLFLSQIVFAEAAFVDRENTSLTVQCPKSLESSDEFQNKYWSFDPYLGRNLHKGRFTEVFMDDFDHIPGPLELSSTLVTFDHSGQEVSILTCNYSPSGEEFEYAISVSFFQKAGGFTVWHKGSRVTGASDQRASLVNNIVIRPSFNFITMDRDHAPAHFEILDYTSGNSFKITAGSHTTLKPGNYILRVMTAAGDILYPECTDDGEITVDRNFPRHISLSVMNLNGKDRARCRTFSLKRLLYLHNGHKYQLYDYDYFYANQARVQNSVMGNISLFE